MRFFIFVALMSAFGIAGAEDVPPYVREAEVRYKQGDYEGAIGYLLAVPGVAQLSPKLTPMNRDSRARLFYDLGCCYLAAGDSLRADWAFREAFALNNRLDRGYFENADPGTFWWALLHGEEAKRRMKTKRLFSAMRSLFVPGWGQFYRGYKKKGYAFLGAVVGTSVALGVQYRDFQSARDHYNQATLFQHINQRYTNEDGTRYTEWEARHRAVKSSEKRVNILIGVLGAIWVLNLFDSAVFEPAPMGLTIAF